MDVVTCSCSNTVFYILTLHLEPPSKLLVTCHAGLLAVCLQHTLGHHVYTNIDGADPDIGASTDEVCIGTCIIIYCDFF